MEKEELADSVQQWKLAVIQILCLGTSWPKVDAVVVVMVMS